MNVKEYVLVPRSEYNDLISQKLKPVLANEVKNDVVQIEKQEQKESNDETLIPIETNLKDNSDIDNSLIHKNDSKPNPKEDNTKQENNLIKKIIKKKKKDKNSVKVGVIKSGQNYGWIKY